MGLAAKIFYSDKADHHLARIVEGAAQLEKSAVSHGFVVVNLVERFPHARTFDNFVNSGITTAEALEHVLGEWFRNFTEGYDLPAWRQRLQARGKLLSVLFFVPTVVHVHGLPTTVVPYYRTHAISRPNRDGLTEAFELALNQSCLRVLAHHP